MKNNTIQEAINNHRKGIYYRKMPREMIENGYIIQDSDMVIGGKKIGYDKLMQLLNTAKDKGIEKIVMTSIEQLIGSREELDELTKAFEKCEVPIITKDGTYKDGKFIPNFLAEADTQTEDNEIIDRETWQKVQAKLGEASNESQDEGFTQTLL